MKNLDLDLYNLYFVLIITLYYSMLQRILNFLFNNSSNSMIRANFETYLFRPTNSQLYSMYRLKIRLYTLHNNKIYFEVCPNNSGEHKRNDKY